MFLKNSKYASAKFWTDTFDRTVATGVQALISTGVLVSAGVVAVDWQQQLSLAGGAALAALGTSIAFRGGASKTTTDETAGE